MVVKTVLPLLLLAAGVSASSLRSLTETASVPIPVCIIENGFDYVDNDIKNVPNKQVNDCCAECDATTGCKAWSWSNFANGTCWLKSGRGNIITREGVMSSLVVGRDPNVKMCGIAADTDFVGNDIGRLYSPTADRCIDLCRTFMGCRAFSWSDYQGGSCWLKSAKGQAIAKQGVTSGEAYPSPSCGSMCALEYDVDYVGNDIGSAKSAAPAGCCDICSKKANCRAYAWTNQNGGTCWLKNFAGKRIAKSGVVSAVVVANPTCTLEDGVDYVGLDIANVPSVDAANCCTLCADRAGCKAYTWSDHQGGTCWLKSGKGATVANDKTKSGVLN